MTTVAWVVGATGLLGRGISRAIAEHRGWTLLEADSLPWPNADAVRAQSRDTARRLIASAHDLGTRWAVIWAAGAAVTSSAPAALATELQQFGDVLDSVGEASSESDAGALGSFFYSSSAGGAYGGSAPAPFDEFSEAVPISDYGRFKLAAEVLLGEFSHRYGVSTLAGRIANLYGPGQKLGKMQGLISHLARAQFSPAPASIFVPLETMRDYIFVSDCALLILDSMDRLSETSTADGRTETMKILASGQAVTISNLLGHFRVLAKGHPHVMLGSSASASLQGIDLRLRSRVWSDLDHRQLTPLPAGIRATMEDTIAQIQNSPL